jgi:hypothetical protein
MKKFFGLPVIISLAIFCSCQKQQTEEERKTEIERQVQERLAAERQAQTEQQLAQRQAELEAREKSLAEKQQAAESAPVVEASETPLRALRVDTSGNVATASYSTFYRKLEPYGVWRETSSYGYVWQPREAERSHSWRPYSNGRWIYTDAGWTWISEEPFGWATYHYGRWTRLRNIGWIWVPEMNGRPPGCRGGRVMITSAGRRCPLKRVSIGAPVFITGRIIITTLGLTNTVSFRRINLARAVSRQPSFRPSAT